MDTNKICICGFFILFIGLIVVILNIYNKEGDISHLSKKFDFDTLEKTYNCPKKILTRLYQIVHFKFNYVYWIFYTLISIVGSVLINYILSQIYNFNITLSSILLTALVIFICMEVPHRFITVHYNKAVEVEGTNLISYLNHKFI